MKQKLKNKRTGGLYAIIAILIAILVSPMTAFAEDNTLRLSVEQIFTTSSETADGIFTYRLKPLDNKNPMPLGSTADFIFTIAGTRKVEIELTGFDKAGIFRYELSQVLSRENPGYIYDSRIYTIEVYMQNDFRSEIVVLNKDGTKAASLEFENSYNDSSNKPSLIVDPPVRKIVSGNPRYNSTFTFALKAGDASWPMPTGSVDGMKTITIEGSGVKDFGSWNYDVAGTYIYTVYEVNTEERGYSYDTAVYTIRDVVTDVSGQLVLSRVITNNANIQVETMAFVNEYSFLGSLVPKTWDDMDLNFYLTLLAAAGAGVIFLIILVKKRKKQKEETNE